MIMTDNNTPKLAYSGYIYSIQHDYEKEICLFPENKHTHIHIHTRAHTDTHTHTHTHTHIYIYIYIYICVYVSKSFCAHIRGSFNKDGEFEKKKNTFFSEFFFQ